MPALHNRALVLAAILALGMSHARAVEVPTQEHHDALRARVEILEQLPPPDQEPAQGTEILTCVGTFSYPAGQLPAGFPLSLQCSIETDATAN